MPADTDALVGRALAGDRVATAKLLSLVEQGGEGARAVVSRLHPHTGRAWSVGITGAPGAGKSTLTDELVMCMRDEDLDVGVLAVDPSSPFSGGAILGDRVRMQRHSTDPGVFIRSMASRGHLGGLALATPQAVRVLDAVGKEWVIVETVGVGQVEVEIASQADTTIVVVNPGWGDEVQAAKAGLLEIADIFVVNKADRPGADVTVSDLAGMLDLGARKRWQPPIVRTIATTGDGLAELWDAIGAHREFLEADGAVDARRRARLVDEIRGLLAERLLERAGAMTEGEAFDALVDGVADRTSDPYKAVDALLGE
ncbi:MAG TPA: methylmalonyl Co-A mutase-associated GTPase MeaB [Acidimicrobiia bacterium]|nr:methylmalonyl Co-A mutase-associated GTPase MeaB [Acidimicrobiia bacterium]